MPPTRTDALPLADEICKEPTRLIAVWARTKLSRLWMKKGMVITKPFDASENAGDAEAKWSLLKEGQASGIK